MDSCVFVQIDKTDQHELYANKGGWTQTNADPWVL